MALETVLFICEKAVACADSDGATRLCRLLLKPVHAASNAVFENEHEHVLKRQSVICSNWAYRAESFGTRRSTTASEGAVCRCRNQYAVCTPDSC